MRFLIIGQRLLQFALLQMQITHNQGVTSLHRELGRQLLNLFERLFRLLQLAIQPVFLHRECLIHAHALLQHIQGINRLTNLTRLCQRIG